jgi:hypothetical protein
MEDKVFDPQKYPWGYFINKMLPVYDLGVEHIGVAIGYNYSTTQTKELDYLKNYAVNIHVSTRGFWETDVLIDIASYSGIRVLYDSIGAGSYGFDKAYVLAGVSAEPGLLWPDTYYEETDLITEAVYDQELLVPLGPLTGELYVVFGSRGRQELHIKTVELVA